jgi:hypothetical protein
LPCPIPRPGWSRTSSVILVLPVQSLRGPGSLVLARLPLPSQVNIAGAVLFIISVCGDTRAHLLPASTPFFSAPSPRCALLKGCAPSWFTQCSVEAAVNLALFVLAGAWFPSSAFSAGGATSTSGSRGEYLMSGPGKYGPCGIDRKVLPEAHKRQGLKVAGTAPNMSLELTPTVRALDCLVRGVGIESMIGSTGERSSAPRR